MSASSTTFQLILLFCLYSLSPYMSQRSQSPADSESANRSSTVCHLCRQRKTKCDRILPRCGFCIKAKVQCQYVSQPKKRGLRAGYVSELESRIGTLEREMHDLRQEKLATPALSPSAPLLATPSFTALPRAPGTPAALPQAMDEVGAIISPIAPTPHVPITPSRPSDNFRTNNFRQEAAAAIEDLQSLPREYLYSLAELWFKETQPWIPILNQEQIQAALAQLPDPIDHIPDIVLRAVLSLEIAYSSTAISLGYHGRRRLSLHLRSEVLAEALATATLNSVQALLIIAFLDYGSDDIPSTFSLLAVCRRRCEHLGLFQRLLKEIELQSPAQAGPPPRGDFGGDELALPLSWATLAMDAVSTLGVTWRDASAALMDHLSSIAYSSGHHYRDSFRTHVHLCAIGLQPLHQFINAFGKGQYDSSPQQALEVCDEIYANFMGYINSQPATTYSLLSDGAIDFDVNTALTYILAYGSIILLYQRLTIFPNTSISSVPTQRCLAACAGLTHTMKNISDADAELNTPLMSSFLFVALRFQLVQSQRHSTSRSRDFDLLIHSLNMCGRRWYVARRYDIVLRAAIAEVDAGTGPILPVVFWDLNHSHLDIGDELKAWIEEYKPSVFVGYVNGPYM